MGDAFFILIGLMTGKDGLMKRVVSILLALLLMSAQISALADSEAIQQGLKGSQEQYADIIAEAIEKSEYEEEQIDQEHIFIVEHTSPIPMRKNEEVIWMYVALPILGTSDISYAHFDEGEYVTAITNFAAFQGMESPDSEQLQHYFKTNYLPEPAQITNMWISERVHLFAYHVICDTQEYIIPYYFTQDSLFNLTGDEGCNIEIGKAYSLDEFLTICEREAELFQEYRNAEREQKENAYTYVDNDGEVVTTKPEEKTEESKEETKSEALTFADITGLSQEDIDHIMIRSGKDGIGYSTAYDNIIAELYRTINTKTFTVSAQEANHGGWSYEIIFFDKENSEYSYTISTGITGTEKEHLTYRTSQETELEAVATKVYHFISNDCSAWAADYIVQAKDLGFLEEMGDVSYQKPITRELFCEIVYHMLMKTTDKGMAVPSAFYFEDTHNAKVSALHYAGIIQGKGDRIFAPDDELTREEAATILYRVAEFMELDLPQSAYMEGMEYYADKDMISDWAFNAVFYMKEMDIMAGTGDSVFSPKDAYTAEQAIATVVRLADRT